MRAQVVFEGRREDGEQGRVWGRVVGGQQLEFLEEGDKVRSGVPVVDGVGEGVPFCEQSHPIEFNGFRGGGVHYQLLWSSLGEYTGKDEGVLLEVHRVGFSGEREGNFLKVLTEVVNEFCCQLLGFRGLHAPELVWLCEYVSEILCECVKG